MLVEEIMLIRRSGLSVRIGTGITQIIHRIRIGLRIWLRWWAATRVFALLFPCEVSTAATSDGGHKVASSPEDRFEPAATPAIS